MTSSVVPRASVAAHPLSICVLGTGRMGLPMARRLCQAGHTVHVWNRTRTKAEALLADGAVVHGNAADAAGQADITLSLLENGPAVAQVLFDAGVADALRAGSLFIDMASIQPAEARDHATRLGERGAVQALSGHQRGGVDFECVGHGFTPENGCLQPSLYTPSA